MNLPNKNTTTQEEIIKKLTNIIMDLDMVDRTVFQSENHVDTTPNTLEIYPEYRTDEFLLEKIGQIITKVLRRIYPNYTIKASIEPQIHHPTDENDDIIGTHPIEHLPKISIRWNSNRWGTEPSDVKIQGRSITPEEGKYIEDPQDAVAKLAAIESIYNSDKNPDQTAENNDTLTNSMVEIDSNRETPTDG